jgi:trehalose synthase
MAKLQEVPISAHPLDRYGAYVSEEALRRAVERGEALRQRLEGRVVWNVNSTAHGGGVAEMLHTLLPYPRALGIDTRWLVIFGAPQFFRITKRLHHVLHGSPGDGGPLGPRERSAYEKVAHANADELLGLVRPRDVVLLHDPQTAGLIPHLKRAGAIVIWRCHIGQERPNSEVARGWEFLASYLQEADATVFTRHAYIPSCCDGGRSVVIPPSIDPFSPKNQELDDATVRAILVHTGLLEGPPGEGAPTFLREDGSPGRVDRHADVVRLGQAPSWETPLVVQISRWDVLKDHLGVMRGFADLVNGRAPADAELVLAGPSVESIADDPEQAEVLDELERDWRALAHGDRNRIHLACLPMTDIEENAAIVNALQRHATVVVQKSIHEGFGLTVTEAMWKARPVVATATGGIQDQIEDGVDGLLVKEPADLSAFGETLRRVLEEPAFAAQLGRNARERVREQFLGLRHLEQYADLIERVEPA